MATGAAAAGASDARTQATVSAMATMTIAGTATRSARATARGPSHTTHVASSPSTTAHAVCDPAAGPIHAVATRAQADAAITLFSAIHAKLLMYSTTATSPAPTIPSAGRTAITDGTRSRGPSGASAATSAAPATLPTATSATVAARLKDRARLAPTWNVVATTLAPTKIRKRSRIDWVCSAGAMGRMSAAFTRA